jgi:uncharacterized protein YbaR (Trm112 family)
MAKSVTKTKTQVPAQVGSMRERFIRDAGKGVSTKAADNLVPLLQVLQPLSPQVLAKNAAQIKGAAPGDFICKSVGEVYSADDGIWFQPVGMYQEWIEWTPRTQGGGFAGRHPYNGGEPPKGAKVKPQERNRPTAYTLGKNDLVDTRYIPGLMWHNGEAVPLVIPFVSTGHAVARAWNTKQLHLQHDGRILPAFAAVYLLKTRAAKNNLGEWFKIDVSAPVVLFDDLDKDKANKKAEEIVGDCVEAWEKGRELNVSFESGEKVAAAGETIEDDERM